MEIYGCDIEDAIKKMEKLDINERIWGLRTLIKLNSAEARSNKRRLQKEIYSMTDMLFRGLSDEGPVNCTIPVWQELEEVIKEGDYKTFSIEDILEEVE